MASVLMDASSIQTSTLGPLPGAHTTEKIGGLTRMPPIASAVPGDTWRVNASKTAWEFSHIGGNAFEVDAPSAFTTAALGVQTLTGGSGRDIAEVAQVGISAAGIDVKTAKAFTWTDAAGNTVQVKAPASISSIWNLKFPAVQGAKHERLVDDGSGNYKWVAPTTTPFQEIITAGTTTLQIGLTAVYTGDGNVILELPDAATRSKGDTFIAVHVNGGYNLAVRTAFNTTVNGNVHAPGAMLYNDNGKGVSVTLRVTDDTGGGLWAMTTHAPGSVQ